jgi:hypothetical protein
MTPLRLYETAPGKFSLLLEAGTTKVEGLVSEFGRSPNGYFWEGVARLLIKTQAPTLDGRLSFDPEAGMFCAFGGDRPALEELAGLMSAVANDPDQMRQLMALAETAGSEFED